MEYEMYNTHGHEYKFTTIKADPRFIFLLFTNRLTHTVTQPKNRISDRRSVNAMPLRDAECEIEHTQTHQAFTFHIHFTMQCRVCVP